MEMNYRTPLGAFECWSDAADACERARFFGFGSRDLPASMTS